MLSLVAGHQAHHFSIPKTSASIPFAIIAGAVAVEFSFPVHVELPIPGEIVGEIEIQLHAVGAGVLDLPGAFAGRADGKGTCDAPRGIGNTGHAPTDLDADGFSVLAPFATGAEVLLVDDADRAIVLGESTDTFRVIRYLEDGTLDPSFATGGLVEIDPGYTTFRARTLRLQSDGKIVVDGIADAGSGNEFAAVRICP